MSRKYEKISKEKLVRRVYQLCDEENICPYKLRQLGKVGADLGKVSVDYENFSHTVQDEWGYWKDMLGVNQIGDLSFWGMSAGGDWEYPVYFIVYISNKKELRAYIPKHGNMWNKLTKEAFGNDEDADQDYFDSLGISEPEAIFSKEEIFEDIKKRFKISL